MRKMNNEEFVQHLMRFSPAGALAQMFILSAITSYAEYVAKIPVDELQESMGPMISAAAWNTVANDILRRYKENYEETSSNLS